MGKEARLGNRESLVTEGLRLIAIFRKKQQEQYINKVETAEVQEPLSVQVHEPLTAEVVEPLSAEVPE